MATDATATPTSLGIPKFNVSADAPSGLGFNAAMDAIDTLIAGRMAVNSVQTSTATVLANKLLVGDAQPTYIVLGSGQISWGAGGANAVDTTMRRSAIAELTVDGSMVLNGGYAELTPRGAAAPNTAHAGRLQVNVNGGGKGELKVLWPGGASAILATEP